MKGFGWYYQMDDEQREVMWACILAAILILLVEVGWSPPELILW